MKNKVIKAAVVQAAPVFMDLNASIDKAIEIIQTAAKNKANIVAFGECWFPGYPWWCWLAPVAHNVQYFQKYHENCLVRDSDEYYRLAKAAADNEIFISFGASERDHGSLYISQFLIDDVGQLISARRKLKPTHMERTIFGDGDGSDLLVSDTELGRIGQLACWEHLQPLSKYALYSMHEQIHIAAWPSFSIYPGNANALGPEVNNAASQIYAVEGQCFVLAPCGLITPEWYDMLVTNDAQAALIGLGGGYAQIYGPDGSALCKPLAHTEEGILFADLDLGLISIAKSFADPVGHYSRPDVTQLLLNNDSKRPIVKMDATPENIHFNNVLSNDKPAERESIDE
uniref:carbon-nitrogen hydrolase family protein n=1 Tax=Ningiella ruwaisensis TaxID=2364274 RepID=UPI0010A06616|nr:carbon-nitrogen hydrolase family protein [Ningiella ruwaisensis]